MKKAPRTIEEARKYRYGVHKGNPLGNDFIEGRCAYEVGWGQTTTWLRKQCSFLPTYGLYCRKHFEKVHDA